MSKITAFNIRVYGLLINAEQEILVVDEFVKDKLYTKFPGGGLEFGEGVVDCLIREFQEETGNTIHVKELFYVNEDFVTSIFSKKKQIICIYYFVEAKKNFKIVEKDASFEFEDYAENIQGFRWIPLTQLTVKEFEFPIDKMVVKKLIKLMKQQVN